MWHLQGHCLGFTGLEGIAVSGNSWGCQPSRLLTLPAC